MWETRLSLAWISHWKCSGIAQAIGKAIQFIDTSDKLQVWAVQDGTVVKSDGNPLNAEAVIKVHGRYRDFALLETPTLGVLTRSSRVATNVYETLMAARGKPVLFFPARFDLHEVAGLGWICLQHRHPALQHGFLAADRVVCLHRRAG